MLLGQHIWGALLGKRAAARKREVWMEYIKNQEPPEPDDNFKVT